MKKKDTRKEVEDLRKLREIEAMIQRGDIENAFVSNASKDSETVSESVADTILQRLDSEAISKRDLGSLISLTSNKKVEVVKRRREAPKARAAPRKAMAKSVGHAAKAPKPKARAAKPKHAGKPKLKPKQSHKPRAMPARNSKKRPAVLKKKKAGRR